MKKKVIISIAAAVICIAALVTVILINSNQQAQAESESTIKSSSEIISAGKADKGDTEAGFAFQYTDRLAGYPATNVESTADTITVTYGSAGTVSKTKDTSTPEEAEEDDDAYAESSERVIGGMKVTFKGSDGTVSLATWQFGGYTYTIRVNNGVSPEDMIEYVKATR